MRQSVATMIAATAVLGVSASAPAQFSRPSRQQQIQLGKQAAQEIRQKERVLPSSDPRVQTLRRVGRRLLSTVNDRNDPWEYSFDVIDSPQLNAFALPGGPTFFYTGLLNKMRSEDELAAVLGHELAHVRREHWAYQYRDQSQRNALLTLGAIIFRPSRTVLQGAGLLSTLTDLKYSRKHETESDDQGYDMMVRAGYNPQGMVDVFTMLAQNARGGRPPEFLSSHPADANRIRRIQEKMRRSGQRFPSLRPMNY